MKKKDLVDFVLKTVPESLKRDSDSRGLASRAIGMALDDMFFKLFSKEPAYMADYMKPFTITPTKYDENISILELPVSTLQFADIGDMVKISYQSDTSLLFVPIRIGEIELIEDIQEIDSVCPFIVKGSSIWIYGLTRAFPLLVECLVAFHDLPDTADVKVPSGGDVVLIQTVRELLGYSNPK